MGTYTANNKFYKPAEGETGVTNLAKFDAALDQTDLDVAAAEADIVTNAANIATGGSDLTTHEADTSTHGVTTVAGVDESQTLTNKTLTTPIIGDLTNVAHDHSNAAGGGDSVSHTDLDDIGSQTHAQLDSHISGTAGLHGTLGSIVGTTDTQTLTNKTLTSPDINGGNVDNAPVGASTPSTGAFTTVAASGLISANGGQIKFPATQNASSNANTLDDYEEGTFTPAFSFGGGTTGITYSSATGRYTKVGRMVHVLACIVLSNKGSDSGVALITELPFTVGYIAPANVSYYANMGGGAIIPRHRFEATQSYIVLAYDNSGTVTQMTDATFNNNTRIDISGWYEV